MFTISKGVVDPKILDVTEEQNETKQNKEIDPGFDFIPFHPYRIRQMIRPDGMIEYYQTLPWE